MINGRYSDDIKYPKIFRDRDLIKKLHRLKDDNLSVYKRICYLSLDVKDKARKLNTDYRLLEKEKHPIGWLIAGIVGIVITFPLYIYGKIFNLTFLEIPNLQIPEIRDPQFHSSIRYGLSLVLAFIFLPLYLVLSLIIFSSWWVGILVFLTLPLSGLFAWNYYLQFRRIKGGFRIRRMDQQKNKDFVLLQKNFNELANLVSGIKNE
jgi:hypothetical protein